MNPLGVIFDPGVLGLAVVKTVVNLLNDHRQPKQSETVVEIEMVHLNSGDAAVKIHELAAGQRTVKVGGHIADDMAFLGIVLLHPVTQGASQIHERITDGAHLPVQNPDDFVRVGRV